MTDLYDQRIDAMKAAEWASDPWDECALPWDQYVEEVASNAVRLAAYKRKRAEYDWPWPEYFHESDTTA